MRIRGKNFPDDTLVVVEPAPEPDAITVKTAYRYSGQKRFEWTEIDITIADAETLLKALPAMIAKSRGG